MQPACVGVCLLRRAPAVNRLIGSQGGRCGCRVANRAEPLAAHNVRAKLACRRVAKTTRHLIEPTKAAPIHRQRPANKLSNARSGYLLISIRVI